MCGHSEEDALFLFKGKPVVLLVFKKSIFILRYLKFGDFAMFAECYRHISCSVEPPGTVLHFSIDWF